jgi:hypothetical protein
MSPVTHFLSGWVLASAFSRQLGKSGKTIVVLASVAPDIDGLGIIPELWIAWRRGESPLQFASERADRALTQALRTRFSR